jgi:4-hydroxy-tetrahydrodipicolinate synthase
MNFKGILPVIHTPFTDSGEIDFDDLRKEVDMIIKDDADGMAVFGYATEFPCLSFDESNLLLETVIDECRGRVPVISSVTAMEIQQAKKDAARYQEMGADAIMTLPRSGDPSEYIKTIASCVTLPILMQYAPGMTGVSMSAAEIAAVAENINRPFGVKSEVAIEFISELLEASDNKIAVYVGMQGIQMPEALVRGASGIMPGCSRVYVYKKIYNEYVKGSKERAFGLFDGFYPYLRVFHGQFEMFWEKYVLVKRGIFKTCFCRQAVSLPDSAAMADFDRLCSNLDGLFYEESGSPP